MVCSTNYSAELWTGGDSMAVIRAVSSVTHYNMDINGVELLAILAALRFRLTNTSNRRTMSYKEDTVQLITLIEGRLKDG